MSQLGRIATGGVADIAVLQRRAGRFAFADSMGACVKSQALLEGMLTIRAGEVVYNPFAMGLPEWGRGA